jgi:hypothetical protein
MGLALEGKAERYKKHQCDRKPLELKSHSFFPWGGVPYARAKLIRGGDAMCGQKFLFDEYFV